MDPFDPLWRGVAVPCLASAIILLLSARPWRPSDTPDPVGRLSAPLAVTGGYALGHLALINWAWPGLPPADTTHWSLFVALAALVLAALESRPAFRPGLRWPARFLLAAGAMTLVLLPQLRSGLSAASAGWLALLTAGTLVWWGAAEETSRRVPHAAFLAALLVILSGASLTLVISNTALLAQLVGALAAATGPLLVLALWKKKLPSSAHLVPVTALVLAAAWANALLYAVAELRGISLLLLAAAVAPMISAWAPPVRRMADSPRRPVRLAAALIPAATAIPPLAAAIALAVSRSAEMAY